MRTPRTRRRTPQRVLRPARRRPRRHRRRRRVEFPEFSSVVVSTLLHGEFSFGVGAIVGSAIFNPLVIPALSALASDPLEATRDIVHKDAQFYIISVLVAGSATINFFVAVPMMGFLAFASLVFVVFTRTHLELTDPEAYGFLALYVAFLAWMVLESVGAVETVRGI